MRRSIGVASTALVACVLATAVVTFASVASPASPRSVTFGDSFSMSSRAAAVRYRDVAIAARDGYRLDNRVGTIEHWRNDDRLVNGTKIDPARPSGLMYEWQRHRRVLVAAVFLMRAPGPRPPRIAGLRWHQHPYCAGPAGIATPGAGAPCPPGTSRRFTPAMTHVFLALG